MQCVLVNASLTINVQGVTSFQRNSGGLEIWKVASRKEDGRVLMYGKLTSISTKGPVDRADVFTLPRPELTF